MSAKVLSAALYVTLKHCWSIRDRSYFPRIKSRIRQNRDVFIPIIVDHGQIIKVTAGTRRVIRCGVVIFENGGGDGHVVDTAPDLVHLIDGVLESGNVPKIGNKSPTFIFVGPNDKGRNIEVVTGKLRHGMPGNERGIGGEAPFTERRVA